MLASELREKTVELRRGVIESSLKSVKEKILFAASHGKNYTYLSIVDDEGCIDRLVAEGYTVKKLNFFERGMDYCYTHKVEW